MTRVSIRSKEEGRQYRLMDYVLENDGMEYLEVKNGSQRRRIPLSEFIQQLEDIQTHKMLPSHGSK